MSRSLQASTPKLYGWLSSWLKRSGGPLLPTTQELRQELLRAIVKLMLVLGVPLHVLLNITIWRDVWVIQRYPPIAFANQAISSVLILGGGALLMYRGYTRAALAWMLSVGTMTTFFWVR